MPTFAEFAERWFAEGNPREWSPKTIERSRELMAYAVRLFGDAPLDRITQEQLRLDMNQLLYRGGRVTGTASAQGRLLSAKTVRDIAFGVQACLEQATDWEYIPKNPMRRGQEATDPATPTESRRPHWV